MRAAEPVTATNVADRPVPTVGRQPRAEERLARDAVGRLGDGTVSTARRVAVRLPTRSAKDSHQLWIWLKLDTASAAAEPTRALRSTGSQLDVGLGLRDEAPYSYPVVLRAHPGSNARG